MARSSKPEDQVEDQAPDDTADVNPGVDPALQEPITTAAPAAPAGGRKDPNEWVEARYRGVLGRVRVPRRSLKYMKGWEEVTSDTPATDQDA